MAGETSSLTSTSQLWIDLMIAILVRILLVFGLLVNTLRGQIFMPYTKIKTEWLQNMTNNTKNHLDCQHAFGFTHWDWLNFIFFVCVVVVQAIYLVHKFRKQNFESMDPLAIAVQTSSSSYLSSFVRSTRKSDLLYISYIAMMTLTVIAFESDDATLRCLAKNKVDAYIDKENKDIFERLWFDGTIDPEDGLILFQWTKVAEVFGIFTVIFYHWLASPLERMTVIYYIAIGSDIFDILNTLSHAEAGHGTKVIIDMGLTLTILMMLLTASIRCYQIFFDSPTNWLHRHIFFKKCLSTGYALSIDFCLLLIRIAFVQQCDYEEPNIFYFMSKNCACIAIELGTLIVIYDYIEDAEEREVEIMSRPCRNQISSSQFQYTIHENETNNRSSSLPSTMTNQQAHQPQEQVRQRHPLGALAEDDESESQS